MHIKTHPRHLSDRVHRLYVAVPLFALCAALSLGSAVPSALQGRVRANVVQEGIVADGEGIVHRNGAVVSLESGQALFAGRGMVRVQTGVFDVRGWNGAFDLTLHAASLDVAALTTPVLVRTPADVWLIPAGMQLRVAADSPSLDTDAAAWVSARQPAPLPPHYLQERLPHALALHSAASFAPAAPDPLLRVPLAGSVLQLESARARAEEDRHVSAMNAIHRALLAGDTAQARAALATDAGSRALRGSGASALLPDLLSLAQGTSLQPLLIPPFAREPDHLMLSLLHPSLRGHAWVLPWPDMTVEERLAVLLSLPAADHAEQAVPPLAVERWRAQLEELLSQHDAAFADAALVQLEERITRLDRRGYPERARRYAAAIVEVFSGRSAPVLNRLDTLAHGTRVIVAEPAAAPMPEPDAEEAPPAAAPLDEAQMRELEASVRALLADAGCMSTSSTAIRAQASGAVMVENVVVGTAAGDALISFRYDAVADRVMDIQKDGRTLPYSLPLAQYLAWVRDAGN